MPKNTQPAILIVDDDVSTLDSLRRQLSTEYECRTENSPTAALKRITSGNEPFAVTLCDMYMPEMDGLALIRKLHLFCPETVCVLLTGGHDANLPIVAINEGQVFHYLQKPCACDEIRRILQLAAGEYQRRMAQKSFTWRISFPQNSPPRIVLGAGSYSITGYRAGDFQADAGLWKSIIVPDDLPIAQDFLTGVREHRLVSTTEFRIRRKDMRSRWLRMGVFSRQNDPDAHCPAAEGFLEDITEQKEMESALQEANRRYEKMVANVPGLVFQFLLQLDGTLRFTFVSSSCRKLFETEPDQVCQDSDLLLKSFVPDDLARLYRLIAESAATLQPLTWQGGVLKNEKWMWMQTMAHPERLQDGQVLWDGLMIDITALKEAERKAQFLALFPSEDPNPVLRIRADGLILYANPAGKTLLDIWQRDIGQQAPEDVLENVRHVVQSGLVQSTEISCKETYFSAVFAPVSRNEAVNLYARDITSAKNAELQLIQAHQKAVEHDKLKSEFVSTVTHELRTPLCIFKNIISNALAGVTGPIAPKLRENLEMAQQSVERLKRIIADFSEISELDAQAAKISRKITFMQGLIKESVSSMRPLAGAKKISLTLNLPQKPVYADVDQDKINKVLENIIGNAIKFIPLRGSIYVTLTDYLHGEFFDICVRDNGPGMTHKEANKVFDRFVQARILKGPGDHGTGLGLTIAREIINLHGGHIWLETEPKCGCAFFFRLPKTEAKAVSKQEKAKPAAAAKVK
ncbi:MAG: PAS domain-containing protein [Planctomycetaceae bacterium]|nr:PAS domain-containing protein [Planctomycetaceae bacterium]